MKEDPFAAFLVLRGVFCPAILNMMARMTILGVHIALSLLLMFLGIGAVGGFLSGLLGIGGGAIFVPALLYAFQVMDYPAAHAMHMAVATSLSIVVLTSSSSTLAHYRRGAVDGKIYKSWTPFSVLGVVLGTMTAASVSGGLLKNVFSVVLAAMSVYMIFTGEKKPAENAHGYIPVLVQRGLACLVGALASMAGLGGGVVLVPMMSFNGTPMNRAVGTGAAFSFTIGLPSAISYMISGQAHAVDLPPLCVGYVSLIALLLVCPASVLAAQLGAKAAHSVPRGLLKRIFGVVLLLVSLKVMLS